LPSPAQPVSITEQLPPADPRIVMQTVMRDSFSQSDAFHHETRSFRNRLVVFTLVGIGVVIGLALLQWRLPTAPVFAVPKDAHSMSRWALLMLVMVFGSIGALVTIIPSMAAIPRVSSPFNFPLQQAFLKFVLGSLTAVVGVIAIGSTGVTNGFASLQALVGIAIIFGAGQQAVTQFLDKRAGKIIDSAQ
jgi:type IV secretory pathway VirB2 component (pilin)